MEYTKNQEDCMWLIEFQKNRFHRKYVLKNALILCALFIRFLLPDHWAHAHLTLPQNGSLLFYWETNGIPRELQSLEWKDLFKLKTIKRQSPDPETHRLVQWEGVLLSQVIENAMKSLCNEKQAKIDLVILKNKQNNTVVLPRAFLSKYPLLLGFQNTSPHHLQNSLCLVVPWTAQPKTFTEDLAIQNFFISHISQIDLTSYQERYSQFFLKRRTDPVAMRGEKLFVHHYAECQYQRTQNPAIREKTATDLLKNTAEHSTTTSSSALAHLAQAQFETLLVECVSLKLTPRDKIAILRYLEARQGEHSVSVANSH